jgi:DNA-binding NtrC family response regulator
MGFDLSMDTVKVEGGDLRMEYSPWAQSPCIMIVDQYEDIRKCVKQSLEREGFKVLTARNSVEALVIAADYPLAIDVLVTESASRVYQNGMELAACFGILRPETRILLTTEPESIPEGDQTTWETSEWDTIAKPFTKNQLLQAVMRAADLDYRNSEIA